MYPARRVSPPDGRVFQAFKKKLLEFDLGADFFDLLLHLFGFSLGDAGLDGLRSSLDEVLGFLEAEAGQFADDLDDLDLVRADVGEDNVEFGLGFSGRGGSGGASSGDGDRAEAETPNLSSIILMSSEISRTDLEAIASRISSLESAICNDSVLRC